MLRRRYLVTAVLLIVLAIPFALAQKGRVLHVVVHSPALEGNLLGDTPDRPVSIYLPPGYDQNPEARYPTVYLLHGYTGTDAMWLGGSYVPGLDVQKTADTLITQHRIQPLILVMPDTFNAYQGSFYTNSSVAGHWEDFIAHDLISYVDAHFRTLARPESRAIAGHDAGGYGALYLAMRHPDIYRVVYAMSPYPMGFNDTDYSPTLSPFVFLAAGKALTRGAKPTVDLVNLAMAVAFSPDPSKPPAYVDLPYDQVDGKPHKIEAVWKRWLAHSPVAMVQGYGGNLKQYQGVAFDVGTDDAYTSILPNSEDFSAALTKAGIAHQFTLYVGNHTDKIATRMHDDVLPYIAMHLQGADAQTSGP